VMNFLEIGSHQLFAQAGFRPWSLLISASWVARIIGMSHQRLASLFSSWTVTVWGVLYVCGKCPLKILLQLTCSDIICILYVFLFCN
jgi:hypothetical protein